MKLANWVLLLLVCAAVVPRVGAQTAVSPVPPRPAAQKPLDASAYLGMLERLNTPETTGKAWRSMSVDEQWKTLENLDRARSSVWYVIGPVPPKPPKPTPTPAQPVNPSKDSPDVEEFRRRLDDLEKALKAAAQRKAQVSLPPADQRSLSNTMKALQKSSQL